MAQTMVKFGAKINPRCVVSVVKRFSAVVFMLALIACAGLPTNVRLTSAEAIRLADSKAQSTGRNPREYHRNPARYDASDDSWWVTYWSAKDKYDQFNIQIEDKTKKAWLVLN